MRKFIADGALQVSEPTGPHQATLVWLHGLGDSAFGFTSVFSDPYYVIPSLRVILPTAPRQPVTINGGMEMNSWYDIESFTVCNEVGKGAAESAATISQVLAREAALTRNLFIGGLSQGGAMALYLGYSAYPGIVKGVIALSTYCFPMEISEQRKQIPGLIMHGEADPLITMSFAQSCYQRSLSGVNYTFVAIPRLAHSMNDEELITVKNWIRNKIT